MMCVAVAAVLSLSAALLPQEPATHEDLAKKIEELSKRVESLEKDKARLAKEVENLERFSQEAAQTISRLKQMIANGGGRSTGAVETPAAPVGGDPKGGPGPSTPVHGKILSVQPEYGFMIVNLGEQDGVKEGWVFEAIRTIRDLDGSVRNELLGKAVFEKYVETARASQSKLKITEGDAEKMKYGDSVVANRRMDPLPPPKEIGEKPAVGKAGAPKVRIFGITGDTYHIDAGSKHGLKQSDRVFVFRDKRAIAQLRLDRVDADVSAGKIIDGTKTAEPAQNDDVLLKDPRTSLVGKVKRIDDKFGIYIEIGELQGAKKGMQFEVRRQGRALGRIVVEQLGPHHAVCKTVGTLLPDEVHFDDFVESVE